MRNLFRLGLPVHEMRLQVHHMVATAMDSLVPSTEPEEPISVTPDQIIYHRRVRVMEHARRTSVSDVCRTFGVSRTTFYRWQHRVEVGGVEASMPKGRRPPAMPNQTPAWVVEELLAEAVVRPTLGARRYAHDMGQRGFVISASGVQKILGRHGLGRRRQRVGALAQLTAATNGLVADDAREGTFGFCHFAARPGDLVALDSFYIGNLKGVGKVWQLTAVDTATRWAICQVFLGPSNTEIAQRFIDLVRRKLRRLGVRVTGVLTDIHSQWCPSVRVLASWRDEGSGVGARPCVATNRSKPFGTSCLLIAAPGGVHAVEVDGPVRNLVTRLAGGAGSDP